MMKQARDEYAVSCAWDILAGTEHAALPPPCRPLAAKLELSTESCVGQFVTNNKTNI